MYLWKFDKKIGQPPPTPHLDKIQMNSSFFSWERPEDPVLQIGQKYQNLKPPSKYEIFFYPKLVNHFVEKNFSLDLPPFYDF